MEKFTAGDLVYAYFSESTIRFYIYIKDGFYLCFGSTEINVFPKLKKIFKQEVYVETKLDSQLLSHLTEEKFNDYNVNIDDTIYESCFHAVFDYL